MLTIEGRCHSLAQRLIPRLRLGSGGVSWQRYLCSQMEEESSVDPARPTFNLRLLSRFTSQPDQVSLRIESTFPLSVINFSLCTYFSNIFKLTKTVEK